MEKINNYKYYLLIAIGVLFVSANNCKKEEPSKINSVIMWENPADIDYGTMLSTIQLNAKTSHNLEGSFIYSPPIGTILNIGDNQELKVDFIPTNTSTHNSASKIVKINILPLTTVTDIDGNVYKVVTIGTQKWMKENLKTTKYSDGSPITNITNPMTWVDQTTGAYCWYNNDPVKYKSTYGAIYNYYTIVNSSKLCPIGWHVPTDVEWTTLSNYLGGENIAGGRLKEAGTTHWESPNTGATNESGFTALPGGHLSGNGTFYDNKYYSAWWSATEAYSIYAWTRWMGYHYEPMYIEYNHKFQGYYVRCLKD